MIETLKHKVLNQESLDKEESYLMIDVPLESLCNAANEIRQNFCGNSFEICTIINAKSGRCSENCKFCAQSIHYKTQIDSYPLLDENKILSAAIQDDEAGIQRFSPVTSGRKLNKSEIQSLCSAIKKIKNKTRLKICASCGLLDKEDLQQLKDAGLSRYHNNLESSENFFKTVCSTHTTLDKISTLEKASQLGLEICSGGIMGLGESWKDRIDMAFSLKKLKAKSIPINMLNPIPGTPYQNNKILSIDEMRRICAIFRFINPTAFIRLAGGRGLLADKGRSCFLSGANATISGDMLTTAGITIETDLKMIHELGYCIEKQ